MEWIEPLKLWVYSEEATKLDFPGGSDSKESVCNAGHPG